MKKRRTNEILEPDSTTAEQSNEQKREYRRVRDAISRAKRELRRKGYEVSGGISYEDVRDLPASELKEITPRKIRESIITGEKTAQDVWEQERTHTQPEIDTFVIDMCYDLIDSYSPPDWRYKRMADDVRNMLRGYLDAQISQYGRTAVAQRLDGSDWYNAVVNAFYVSKQEQILSSAQNFASIVKGSYLTMEDVRILSDYSAMDEEIHLPHGEDL